MTDETTREQAQANMDEASKLLATKQAALDTIVAEFAAARKQGAIDDMGLLEIGGKVGAAKNDVTKATRVLDNAKHALDVFTFAERAADRNKLIARASKAFRDAVKTAGLTNKLVLVVKATDDIAAKWQAVNARILELTIERETLAACSDIAWGELGELASDGVRFTVTPAPEGSPNSADVAVAATAKGETVKRSSGPRASGNGKSRKLFGQERLSSTEYARKYADADSVAKVQAAIDAGKSASFSHLATATASKRGDPIVDA